MTQSKTLEGFSSGRSEFADQHPELWITTQNLYCVFDSFENLRTGCQVVSNAGLAGAVYSLGSGGRYQLYSFIEKDGSEEVVRLFDLGLFNQSQRRREASALSE